MTVRSIAIDWSGARTGARRKIRLAETVDRTLVRVEGGRDRDAIAEHLIAEAQRAPNLVVGLDFAFSVPDWFFTRLGLASAVELWARADRDAETWLAECRSPFWGRPGVARPELPTHFRRTESEAPSTGGIRPKSVFQVGGAGTAGTGSLRGMRLLLQLHATGYSVWPFDPPSLPMIVEIYPRLLTGAVNKSNSAGRAAYLASRYPELTLDQRATAAQGEDAFDAAVSALVMAEHIADLTTLPALTDPLRRREGQIWYPGWRSAMPDHG